jgi:CBS domain-containing protein
MREHTVGSLMVPISEYATVPHTATLCEAVRALDRAQAAYHRSYYHHRAVLVLDEEGKAVGKLSQMDLVRALDPDIGRKLGKNSLARFGISDAYLEFTMDRYGWLNRPLRELCVEAGNRKVSDCMYSPSEDEYVNLDATLQEAVHRLFLGERHSLLVMDDDVLVGVLRLTDVFSTLTGIMKDVCGERCKEE